MAHSALDPQVQAVREFNRFYTRQIGILQEGLYKSPFSLTEVRVLYELSHRKQPTATELCRELGLDSGYLSRILRSFEKRGLVGKIRSEADGRQSLLSLTAKGAKVFRPLDEASSQDASKMLSALHTTEQARLVGAMRTIGSVLAPKQVEKSAYMLRTHQPGDMGWIVYRHGILYSQEYGYDENFEALVAEIVAEFIQNLDPKRERCWIAERDGEILGSVFLVKKSRDVAKLRLLLVEPSARGLGIGKRLVSECIRFARQAGYEKITLWTQSELKAARHLYEQAGFHLVDEKKHHSWTRDLVSETWELDL